MRLVQKLYCYVDESGQETKGKLFSVAVVVLSHQPNEWLALCERLEHSSGKGKFKWGTAKRELRLAYLRSVFAETKFRGSLYFSIFRDTMGYDVATITAIAKAVQHIRPSERFTTLVYIDGLKKSRRLKYGSELRKLGIPTRKVQGGHQGGKQRPGSAGRRPGWVYQRCGQGQR